MKTRGKVFFASVAIVLALIFTSLTAFAADGNNMNLTPRERELLSDRYSNDDVVGKTKTVTTVRPSVAAVKAEVGCGDGDWFRWILYFNHIHEKAYPGFCRRTYGGPKY